MTPARAPQASPALGRELDEAIAVELFGWERTRDFLVPPKYDRRINWAATWDEAGRPDWLDGFSTDITAAWTVMDRMRDRGFENSVELVRSEGARVSFCFDRPVTVFADDAPEAICRAALAALKSTAGGR